MLNLIHHLLKTKSRIGAATLVMTFILLVTAILIMMYAATFSSLQQKASSSGYGSNQAYEAAEAGLQFGLVYLIQNSSTITANPSNGYINYGSSDSNITNITLANNSKFSIVYTNPNQNNYQLLTITSTGTGFDGSSTRILSEQVYQEQNTIISSALAVKNVNLVGGSTLTNTINNTNIATGGTVTINNNGATYTSSGQTSYQGHIGSDVVQNVASYQGMSESSFFKSVFGVSETTERSTVQTAGNYYSNSGPDYSQALKGKQGQTIWINQTNGSTVTLGQGVTIGSAANPVTLIVQGDLSIANGVTFYGFIYASGPDNGLSLAGGAKIYGGIASAGKINISNNVQLVYNKFPLLTGGSGTYAKVPGTWKDF